MSGLVADVALVVQAALVLTVLEALRQRNVPALVNNAGALGLALLPAGLRATTGLAFGPELPLWIALAGFIHALGMLELYDRLWWWDHLAHTVSAALVTALTYAAVLVGVSGGAIGSLSTAGVVGVTLGFLLAVAVFWELLEELARHVAERLDVGPLLTIYGPLDSLFDLAFNLVGAGVVLLLDLRVFVPVFEPFPGGTARLLIGVGVIAVAADGLLAAYLYVARED